MRSSRVLAGCCKPITSPATEREAARLEQLLTSLADRNRIRIVNILANADDAVCVCDLVPALGLTQATVSYHLKQLAEAGIIDRERRGTYSHYRLVPGALRQVGFLFREPASLRRR